MYVDKYVNTFILFSKCVGNVANLFPSSEEKKGPIRSRMEMNPMLSPILIYFPTWLRSVYEFLTRAKYSPIAMKWIDQYGMFGIDVQGHSKRIPLEKLFAANYNLFTLLNMFQWQGSYYRVDRDTQKNWAVVENDTIENDEP